MTHGSDTHLLLRLAGYGWVNRGRWAILLLTTAATGALSGALFGFLSLLLDALMGKGEKLMAACAWVGVEAADTHTALVWLGLAMIALAPLVASLAYTAWYTGQWLANRANQQLRGQLVAHLVDLDLTFHGDLGRGDLLTRLTADLHGTQQLFQIVFGKILQRPALALGTVGALFFINLKLALVVFGILLPAGAVLSLLLRRTRTRSRSARHKLAENVSALEQITAGIRVIKAMGSAGAEVDRYARANGGLYAANMRLARSRALTDAVTNGAIYAASGLCILAAAWMFARKLLEPREFVTFVAGLGQLTSLLRSANRSWGEIQEALPACERVFALLDRVPAIRDRPDARDCPVPQRAISLRGVTFAYGDGQAVLERFDLDVPIGRSLALVGESGAGKSTIVNLIPRFHDPQQGAVLFDDVDIREYRRDSLVRHVAIVPQDAFLFAASVADNIRYGRPGADDAAVETAARQAYAHEAILALEGGTGYATHVGDRGERLSGGQRQRVAIARAFLRNAPLLLLDEPTSALDAESERHIQAALKALLQGRTAVIIAHRLATIRHCDHIAVLGKGRGIIESGTHDELIARDGEYARLVRLQALH